MQKIRAVLFLLGVFLAIISCSKDESGVIPGPGIISSAPIISDFGLKNSDTTITLGSKIEFSPKIVSDILVTHLWFVNSENTSSSAEYSFEPLNAGIYSLKYIVSNSFGRDSCILNINVKQYDGGFYIVNEGWFGHDKGSLNYFNPRTSEMIYGVYDGLNSGMNFGITTCYATQWMDDYYIISKQNRRLVRINALTLKDNGSLSELSGTDGRAFAGIDDKTGVVTTSSGAYLLELNPLRIGAALDHSYGSQCGGVYVEGDNVFVISSKSGILIYSISKNYALVKEYSKGSVGFARSKDGFLWAANGSELIKIDVKTLDIESVVLPPGVIINNTWGAWNKGSLCASPIDNVLFFTKSGIYGGGREIYRYVIGDINSLNSTFAQSTQSDDAFYGSGIAVNPQTGDLVASFTQDGWGDSYNDNRLVVFDGKSGVEKSRISYDGFWFPAMIMFNN